VRCGGLAQRGKEEDETLGRAIRPELQRDENRAACSRRSSVTRETGMVRQRRAEGVRIDGEVSGGYSRKIGERNAEEFSSASEEICRSRTRAQGEIGSEIRSRSHEKQRKARKNGNEGGTKGSNAKKSWERRL